MSAADGAGPRRLRTPSADVARELVTAAEEVLFMDGVTGLTVRAVAAAAGVAPMSVYNQFGGKNGLLEAVLVRGFERLQEAIDVDGDPDAATRLRRCCLRYRQFALANPRLYAVLFDHSALHASDQGKVEQRAAACFGVLARNVELAAAAGALAAANIHEAAQQIWSAVHGAVTLELKGLGQTPDPAATFEAFLETLMRGLARRPSAPEGYFGDGAASALS